MESQVVQNSRNKIGLMFNKFVVKVKRNFNVFLSLIERSRDLDNKFLEREANFVS